MTYSALIGQTNCMPQIALLVPSRTVPTGRMVSTLASKLPLRWRKVVWILPSSRSS